MDLKIRKSNMYDGTKTWNPFKGCEFDCLYCRPSFQRQAKRQKQRCAQCGAYVPHVHEERLNKIPSSPIVFVAGVGDISFCDPVFFRQILASIHSRNERRPDQTYYFQSKRPAYFEPFLEELPENAVLLTTLETNRDEGYGQISQAPVPSERYRQFLELDYPRKVVTIEPVMDFDHEVFLEWIRQINPEYVYLGFNSKPKAVQLPEPSGEKLQAFMRDLNSHGIEVHLKELRGLRKAG